MGFCYLVSKQSNIDLFAAIFLYMYFIGTVYNVLMVNHDILL